MCIYLFKIIIIIFYFTILYWFTWNSAQCYVAVWIVGEFVGEQIHVCVWPSPFTVHLKLSQQC